MRPFRDGGGLTVDIDISKRCPAPPRLASYWYVKYSPGRSLSTLHISPCPPHRNGRIKPDITAKIFNAPTKIFNTSHTQKVFTIILQPQKYLIHHIKNIYCELAAA